MKIRAIPEASPLRQRGRTSDWMVRAGYKETDMSKSIDTSKLGLAMQVRELRDDELENVSGGVGSNDRPMESISFLASPPRRSALISARAKIWW